MSPPTMINVLHDAVLHARQHVVHQADVPEQVEIRHHREDVFDEDYSIETFDPLSH